MTAKIIKFGTITQDEDGDLVFQNFHIDANHEYETGQEAILQLVIKRLENELAQLKALWVKS